jgi:hypothetical protein
MSVYLNIYIYNYKSLFNTIKNILLHYNKIINSEKKVIKISNESNIFTRIS